MVPLLCSKQGPASPELAELCHQPTGMRTLLETAPQFRIPKRVNVSDIASQRLAHLVLHSVGGGPAASTPACCIHPGLLRRTKERACAENKCRKRCLHKVKSQWLKHSSCCLRAIQSTNTKPSTGSHMPC